MVRRHEGHNTGQKFRKRWIDRRRALAEPRAMLTLF